jgi:pimeloyl-ACP methyl ester carboxylesterase
LRGRSLRRLEFEVAGEGPTIAGEEIGDGPPIVALHGLTASRHYVVHRSLVLPRRGFRLVLYDARGHGASAPAPEDAGYAYRELAGDLATVLDAKVGEGRALLAGHSMGAHTITGYALAHPGRVAGLVLIGPALTGAPPTEDVLANWDRLADSLEREGVEGFISEYDRDLDPRWRETLLRITRKRLSAHRHPKAVARALREVPRSAPFDGLSELEHLEVPALVVASHDDVDRTHPYSVAGAWAERLPDGRLVSEKPGEAPLAWQGGRLSREIVAFCERPEVARRLAG